MKFKKTTILSFIVIFFCIASFFIGMKYKSNQTLKQNKKYYLNHFYFQLDNTINLLSSVDNWEGSIHDNDTIVDYFEKLLNDLNTMRVMNEQALLYMMDDRDSNFLIGLKDSFYLIGSSIEAGMSVNDQILCLGFLQDDIISKKEIAFLTYLRQDLQSMKDNLYSGKTKQENPNLTMKEVSEAVKQFTRKYSFSNITSMKLKN